MKSLKKPASLPPTLHRNASESYCVVITCYRKLNKHLFQDWAHTLAKTFQFHFPEHPISKCIGEGPPQVFSFHISENLRVMQVPNFLDPRCKQNAIISGMGLYFSSLNISLI